MALKKGPAETPEAFCIRRNRATANAKASAGIDIKFRFAYKLATWLEHVYRHKAFPSYRMLQCQDNNWLRQRRRSVGKFGSSRSLDHGETATRSGPGPPLRWAGVWVEEMSDRAGGWENAARSKEISKSRALHLKQHYLCRSNRSRLALVDAASVQHGLFALNS